jgi:hypothetical protein
MALLLVACGDDPAPEEGEVSGEVLEGTISDAMLPLDQVRSRAPLAEPTESAGAAPAAAGDTAEPAEEPVEAEPDPAPAEVED